MSPPFFDSTTLALATPEFLLLGLGIVLVALDLFLPTMALLQPFATILGAILALAMAATTLPGTGFGGMFVMDSLAGFFKVLCLLGLVFTVLLSGRTRQVEGIRHGEYYSLLVFATCGMMVMVSAANLMVAYLGLELMALSVYCLVALAKRSGRAPEAALKYFLTGAFSSALLLYGISLVYTATGTIDLAGLARILAAGNHDPLLLAGLALVLAGLLFKVGAAPFHMWAPDVYEGAPTAITAFMSVAPKAASFALLARVLTGGFLPVQPQWGPLLAAVALLTMAVGNVIALAQRSVKRMLAYSSIAHAGYALLGVLAGTAEGLTATMTYLFIYAFMNMGAFAVVVLLGQRGQRRESLDEYRGLAGSNPILALVMLLFMFSLTGIPPTAGFTGKFSLLMAAAHAGYTGVVVAAVLLSAVSAYYYLRVVRYMYMAEEVTTKAVQLDAPLAIALCLAVAGVVGLGIAPGHLVGLATSAGLLP